MIALFATALAGRYPSPPPACPEPARARLQITGTAPDGMAVWVDGKPVAWQDAYGSFLSEPVPAGEHDVRVVRGTLTLYAGPMKLYGGLVRSCVPLPGAFQCVHAETVVAVPPPSPPPLQETGPSPMADAAFASFLKGAQAETFSSTRIDLVKSVARGNWFTIDQVGRVMDTLTHSSDKLDAARILAPRTLDPENAWHLNEHLTHSSDKEAVQAMFADGR